jgi:hypothetical protein
MSLPDFLENHLSVTKGAQVSPTALDRHVKTLKWLNDEFPDTMGTHAVAVNGNGVFCTADSLYDHHDSTFMAAFHHQPSKFLHPKLRHLSWRTIKAVTSARVYRQCALGIEEQAAATRKNSP